MSRALARLDSIRSNRDAASECLSGEKGVWVEYVNETRRCCVGPAVYTVSSSLFTLCGCIP